MVPTFTFEHLDRPPMERRATEFVERKGLGHPDTISDGVAEAVSRQLSRAYIARTGRVRHHNTDAVQLIAGATDPAFGGGEVLEPFTLVLAGRATKTVDGETVPVDDIAIQAARDYLEETIEELDAERVRIESRIGETSTDLRSLFDASGIPLANDTSVGVGYAPLSETDRIVRDLEPAVRGHHQAVGSDVKVMGRRQGDHLHLTVAAAIVSRHVPDREEYVAVVEELERFSRSFVTERTGRSVSIEVNAADDRERDAFYLTVTGLSAEMGDDGNVGRGNRANGLITPHRPMSLEATAGKNPVSHVGKLYNVLARRAARRIHRELDADHAGVKLVSEIGSPITEPNAVDVDSTSRDEDAMRAIVLEELRDYETLTEDLVAGTVSLF